MDREEILIRACPVCDSARANVVLEIPDVLVHCNVLWPSRREALEAARGEIKLAICEECGHIFNLAFDPSLMEYTQAYENSLHFSPRYQSYASATAERLIDRYDLRGKTVIEIGCGKGEFLDLLCRMGHNRGIGFDPSYVSPENGGSDSQVTFVTDFYDERYSDYQADLICCRHMLEHVGEPRVLLDTVRRSIRPTSCPCQASFFSTPCSSAPVRRPVACRSWQTGQGAARFRS